MKTYRPNEAHKLSSKELRSEYSRLRQAANRRLANLEKNNLGTWGSRRFGSIRGMSDEYAEAALLKVSRYLRDDRHTVRGERSFRARELESLHKSGYHFITEENFYEFTDFMDEIQKQYSEKVYDSTDAVKVFETMIRLQIDPDTVKEHYDLFAANSHKLDRLRMPIKENGYSYQAFKKKLKRLK